MLIHIMHNATCLPHPLLFIISMEYHSHIGGEYAGVRYSGVLSPLSISRHLAKSHIVGPHYTDGYITGTHCHCYANGAAFFRISWCGFHWTYSKGSDPGPFLGLSAPLIPRSIHLDQTAHERTAPTV